MTGAESYFEAATAADDRLQDALADLCTREAAGELTVRQAAGERVRLLEEHLAAHRQLSRQHLGTGQDLAPP